jgi:hypothetical protein
MNVEQLEYAGFFPVVSDPEQYCNKNLERDKKSSLKSEITVVKHGMRTMRRRVFIIYNLFDLMQDNADKLDQPDHTYFYKTNIDDHHGNNKGVLVLQKSNSAHGLSQAVWH